MYLNKAGREGGDVTVSTDVLAVEGQAVVDHSHDEPREEDVQGSFPHFRRLNKHDQLLEDLVHLLLLGLGFVRMFNFFLLLKFSKIFFPNSSE